VTGKVTGGTRVRHGIELNDEARREAETSITRGWGD
jgi:hypothetical protein